MIKNIADLPPMSLRIDAIADAGGVIGVVVYASGVPDTSKNNFGASLAQAIVTATTGLANWRVAKAINSAYDYITINMQTYPNYTIPIELAGHSNGGQVLANYASSGTYKDRVQGLTTFGSPVTKWAQEFPVSTAVLHIKDDLDPVPAFNVLLKPLANGTYKSPTAYPNDPSYNWIPNVSVSAKTMLRVKNWSPDFWTALTHPLGAHFPPNYVNIAKTLDQAAAQDPNSWQGNFQIGYTSDTPIYVAKTWTVAYGG